MIVLIKNFDPSSIKFNKSRKTTSGSIIIDIEDMPLLQSSWCKIVYPVEHTINVQANGFLLEKCQQLDDMIVQHCAQTFDLCPQDITEMYKSIIRKSEEKYTFRISMNASTVIFNEDEEYTKSNAGEILKVNNDIRFIFKLKKITMANHEIKVQTDLVQVETKSR